MVFDRKYRNPTEFNSLSLEQNSTGTMAVPRFKAESGVQLFARLIKRPEIHNFYTNLFQSGLKNHDNVELFVDKRSSYLLIDLICEAILPNKACERPIGVLVFNTDGQLNFQDLISILKKKILHHIIDVDCQNEMDSIIHKTLNNLFILNIYDATQFYTTIYNLDNILTKNQNISLIIFNTITAFYWSEQGYKITKMDLYLKNVLKTIQNVTKEYKTINIFLRPRYFSSTFKDSGKQENGGDAVTEGINFRVQLGNNSAVPYQVIVKTSDLSYIKLMSIIDNEVKWH